MYRQLRKLRKERHSGQQLPRKIKGRATCSSVVAIKLESPPEGIQCGSHVKGLRMLGSKANQTPQTRANAEGRAPTGWLWLGVYEFEKKEYAFQDPYPTPEFTREKSGANKHTETHELHLGAEHFKMKPTRGHATAFV